MLCSFIFLMAYFDEQRLLILTVKFITFFFSGVLCVPWKKLWHLPKKKEKQMISLCFLLCYVSIRDLAFMFRSLIHLQSTFLYMVSGSRLIFIYFIFLLSRVPTIVLAPVLEDFPY